MEITGRVVKDAQVRKTKKGQELVAFTVAVNDSYKPKGGDRVDVATFFSCSYWQSTNVAKALKASSIVSLFGHAGINAYKGTDGEFYANLTFHVNNIKIIATAKGGNALEPAGGATTPDKKKDLPF